MFEELIPNYVWSAHLWVCMKEVIEAWHEVVSDIEGDADSHSAKIAATVDSH